MKIFKRVVSLVLCMALLVCASSSVLHLSAKTERFFDISLSKISAVPGDTVVIALDVKNNPGIMAITFTLHYDPEVLEYEKYMAGILSRDTFARHDGYVSFVWCGMNDRTGDGTLYSFQFKVKDTAKAGFTGITLKNIRPAQYGDSLKGCFANWNGDKLTPTLTSGGVTVGFTGENCSHKFGEWETVHTAGCTTEGVRSHNCTVCGHNAQEPIPATGHSYDENWTIDRAATDLLDGLMSRHCKGAGCDATTDKVNFTVRDAEGNGFSNTVGTVIPPDSWKPLKDITDERVENENKEPEKEETVITPAPVQPEKPVEDKVPEETIEKSEEELPITDADKLVETAKKEDTVFIKWHSYLFGTDDSVGLFEMLFSSDDGGIWEIWRNIFVLLFGWL